MRLISISKLRALAGLCGPLLYLLSVCLLSSPSFSTDFSARYDAPIRAAVNKWWLDLPEWRLLKAQYYQESLLDPTARSQVGAEGVAQFMEPSWQDVIHALNWPKIVSRRDAAYAIEGGAWYMAKLRRSWKGRESLASHDLALGSYNAGMGSLIKAQKLCNDARLWGEIAPCIDQVTGPQNGKQTRDYVIKIHRWYKEMQ